jgi:predicted alpha/beta superfamily hydrolase
VTVIALLSAAVAAAQPPSGDVVIGRREIVHSAILNEDRPILVSLPPPPSPPAPAAAPARFPVMVVLDGEWSFEHTVAAARFLAGNGLVPPMIVVGVVNVDRGRDLMPRFSGRDFAEGPSDRFLAFLADERLPHLDRTYPTLPYRVLVGHSNAGMFSLYALMRRPGIFPAHFVMSPSFGQNDRFVAALDRFLASRERLDAFVYVSAGDEEADVSVGAIRFAKAIEAGAPAGLEWRYEYFEGESHGSVVHKAVYRGLELLGFADGVPPTAAAAFLPKTELRRRAWVRRFGSDFGTPPMARASIAGPLLRVLAESGSAQLGAQYVFLRSTDPDSFRFDAVELEKLETWLASQGRAKDSEAVRALRGSPTASRSPHLPASPAEAP